MSEPQDQALSQLLTNGCFPASAITSLEPSLCPEAPSFAALAFQPRTVIDLKAAFEEQNRPEP